MPYTVPTALEDRAQQRRRPFSAPYGPVAAPDLRPHLTGRGVPVHEEHRVLTANNAMRYLSIVSVELSPFAEPGKRIVRTFPQVIHVPAFRRVPCGRMDGKPFGGRVGRSRGLGGNPTAWRADGVSTAWESECSRSFSLRPGRPATPAAPSNALLVGMPPVGMRTEAWSLTEGCIYGASGKLGRRV